MYEAPLFTELDADAHVEMLLLNDLLTKQTLFWSTGRTDSYAHSLSGRSQR